MEYFNVIVFVIVILYLILSSATGKKKKPTNTPKPMQFKPKPLQPDRLETIINDITQKITNKENFSLEKTNYISEDHSLEKVSGYEQQSLENTDPESVLPFEKRLTDYKKMKKKRPQTIFKGEEAYQIEKTPYAIKKPTKSKYGELLKDSNSLRNAFILGEIFNRKF